MTKILHSAKCICFVNSWRSTHSSKRCTYIHLFTTSHHNLFNASKTSNNTLETSNNNVIIFQKIFLKTCRTFTCYIVRQIITKTKIIVSVYIFGDFNVKFNSTENNRKCNNYWNIYTSYWPKLMLVSHEINACFCLFSFFDHILRFICTELAE